MRVVEFHDEPGVRAGTIIDLADVTELRAAQREREDVLRFLSHDMKSPATSLLGLAQLQRDPARALGHKELSQRLDLLAQRVLTLVDNFVALARAESADPARFGHFDLRDAVQDAYDEVWAAAQAREITISPSVSEAACMVSGDRQLLARAIINLLSNAIKFSAPGSGIELLCEDVAENAVVSIVDHGAGIEPAQRAALFQRFSAACIAEPIREVRGWDSPSYAWWRQNTVVRPGPSTNASGERCFDCRYRSRRMEEVQKSLRMLWKEDEVSSCPRAHIRSSRICDGRLCVSGHSG